LILRGADGYDEARFARVFNARRPERYPAAVLVAESEDDVVESVRLAWDRGWKVAIRAGGHSFPAWSLRDDGLLIDLGAFKETAFDESTGLVSVTPSVSGGELNAHLSGYGRFFTTGDCPSRRGPRILRRVRLGGASRHSTSRRHVRRRLDWAIRTLVVRGGPIGQLCCRLARHFGAGRVWLSEPSAERRSYAEASLAWLRRR
jgi:hypothetical protein